MRRIIVKEARPGMVAARALAHPQHPGVPLVNSGDKITIKQIIEFHQLGIYDLWVNDPGLEFLEDMCGAQPTIAQQRLAEALRDSFLHFYPHLPAALFRRHDIVIQELVQTLVATAPVVPCFRAFTEDAALLAHSCDVAVLSILLGIHLEGYLIEQRRRLNCRQARDVLSLALGALFHDVGELMLPPQERESRLGDPALGEDRGGNDGWKQHTVEGFAIGRGKLDPSAGVVIQHHHEHFDGSGFTRGAAGGNSGGGAGGGVNRPQNGSSIHVHARIAMAADVFCQCLFSDAPAGRGGGGGGAGGGRMPQPMVRALWHIQQMPMRQWFDPVVHEALMSLLAPFADGMVVTLDNRQQAVVVKDARSCYPEVRTIGGEADASAVEEYQMDMQALGTFGGSDLENGTDHAGGDQDRRSDAVILAVDGSKVDDYLYGVRRNHPLVAA